jgi:Predicted integral membrane protein (DUF2269)
MSFGDKAILWLHIAAAVFTIGPGTAAIMSTPRYIRNRNSVIVGYLFRTTRIYALGSLLVLVFGLILTGMTHKFSQWWISVSLTLFVVAFVLLMLILRDQRRAITALDAATGTPVAGMAVADNVEEDIRADAAQAAAAAGPEAGPVAGGEPAAGAVPAGTRTGRHAAIAAPPAAARTADQRVAAVERGRIASIGGVTALIWLVILVLMVWH